jgi:hypothetical protein
VGSTQRNDTRRAIHLERLSRASDKRPDLSLGRLLAGALDKRGFTSAEERLALGRIGEMDGSALAAAIERFVLLDAQPGSPLERIAKAGDQRPDLSLTQLLTGALEKYGLSSHDEYVVLARIAAIDDSEFVGDVERFVLLDPGGPKTAG